MLRIINNPFESLRIMCDFAGSMCALKFLLSSLIILFVTVPVNGQDMVLDDPEYRLGTGIADITRLLNGSLPHNTGTYGYARYISPVDTTINRPEEGIVNGVHLPLKTRILVIERKGDDQQFIYGLLDLGFVSHNIRDAVIEKIRTAQPDFDPAYLLLTATHTHSAPGGFSDYMGYEVAAPGYRPDIVEMYATRTFEAIQEAWSNMRDVDLILKERTVPDNIPIAFSRKGLPAYNQNPEITEPVDIEHNYKATDRLWQLIDFRTNEGSHSILSFFGAHPNRMGADVLSSDTRGAASEATEKHLPKNGLAIFAQNAPGDIDSEGSYRRHVDPHNQHVIHPAYFRVDSTGKIHQIPTGQRVIREGEFLRDEALATVAKPEREFRITGPMDAELIYVDMEDLAAPIGNYPETLDPLDYYKNDYYLFGALGRFGSLFKKDLKKVHTTPPTIGLAAIARISPRLIQVMTNLELFVRYNRLFFSGFTGDGYEKTQYIWRMYRGQAQKVVMLEGGEWGSALGFKIGGGMFNLFDGFDPVLVELARDRKEGIHDEHTFYPQVMPIHVVIIGNLAILGVSGEPGNIAGQRMERTVLEVLKDRGVERVIMNGYSNENTGYIFTPEEYNSQYEPQQCGFQLYGRWTSPVVRYQYEKLARAMLLDKSERHAVLDYETKPPVFSEAWYEKASFQEFLPPSMTRKQRKALKRSQE